MFKKISFISLALLGITLFQTSGKCFAEATLAEEQQNVCNLISAGKLDEAKSATDKLMSDFSSNKDLPEAVYWTIRHCEWKDKFDEAKRLYQIMIQKYPDNARANQAQIGIARCEAMALVMSQDYTGAKEALDKMAIDFSSHPDLPESLYMVAERFEWQWQFEKEKYVYQKITQNHPQSEFADKAKIGIARADVLSFIVWKDYNKVDKGIDKLFLNFADNQELAQTVIIIGEWFYKEGLTKEKDGLTDEAKNQFEKAVKVWDRVITELPNSDLIPEACCWAGDCYIKLVKYEESSQRFKKVVEQYPEYKFAGHAQFEIGKNYLRQAESGLMAVSEAQTKTRLVYEQLLRKYPTCQEADYARVWLYRNE